MTAAAVTRPAARQSLVDTPAASISLADQIAALLDNGTEWTPIDIARYLSRKPQSVRSAMSLMASEGHLVTRGDGFYFVTPESRAKRAVRVDRRRKSNRPDSPIIGRYLEHCRRKGLRPNYVVGAVRITLRRVEADLGTLEHATEAQLEGWFDTLQVTAGSRVAYASHLSSFFTWLVWERIRDDDPTVRLIRPRLQRGLPRPVSDDDLQRAFVLADDRTGLWLALAAYAGLRCCEIATIEREDIRADLDALIVRDGKGGKQRIVPTHPEITSRLGALELPAAGPLFLNGSGKALRANTVSQRTNRFLHNVAGTTATMHQLRHWFGVHLYRASTDLRLTQEILGHASPNTTARYTGWSPDRAAGFINTLSAGTPQLVSPPVVVEAPSNMIAGRTDVADLVDQSGGQFS